MSDLTPISRAYFFAKDAHKGQVRKYTGLPYLSHLMNVAEIVADRTDDEDIIMAAYLHDTIEDTKTSYYELVATFGYRVADLVVELTDVYTHRDYPHLNRAMRKSLEAIRLGTISDDAKIIKLADIADNTADIVRNDPKFAVLYLREKADVLLAMRPLP